ncbi:unnamed protein product [Prunus armeniaca]
MNPQQTLAATPQQPSHVTGTTVPPVVPTAETTAPALATSYRLMASWPVLPRKAPRSAQLCNLTDPPLCPCYHTT